MTEYVGIISALTALISVIVGPFVTLYVARKQMQANVVSQNRIRWVEELREDIANFISTFTEAYYMHERLLKPRSEKDTVGPPTRDEVRDANQRLSKQRVVIRLKLNPNKDLHSQLLELIQKSFPIREFAQENDRSQTVKYVECVIDSARGLLKVEWRRARNLQ